MLNFNQEIIIREIRLEDNQAIAQIIRASLLSYDLALPGTSYYDENLDQLYQYYQEIPQQIYLVAEVEGKVIGGGGLGQISPLSQSLELQKLYLLPEYHRQGIAKMIVGQLIDIAREWGYQSIYLESSSNLKEALDFYHSLGFQALPAPLEEMAASHFTMDQWMLLTI